MKSTLCYTMLGAAWLTSMLEVLSLLSFCGRRAGVRICSGIGAMLDVRLLHTELCQGNLNSQDCSTIFLKIEI